MDTMDDTYNGYHKLLPCPVCGKAWYYITDFTNGNRGIRADCKCHLAWKEVPYYMQHSQTVAVVWNNFVEAYKQEQENKKNKFMRKEILEFAFPIPITIDGKNYKIVKEIFDLNEINNRPVLQDIIVIDSENQELSISSFPDGSKIIADINVEHLIRAGDFHRKAGTIFNLTVWDDEEV